MKKIISYIAISVLLVACSKNANKQVTVTGRLMQSCETPAANKDGIIRLSGGGLLANPSTSLEFTTDENGYFKVTHDESFSQFSVRTSAAHNILEVKSLGGDEKELGEVYINPFPAKFIINLDVKNQYTENDTLVMFDFNNPNASPSSVKLYPGPFSSGTLDTIDNYSFSKFPVNYSNLENHGGPYFKMNYLTRSLPNYQANPIYSNFYLMPICSGEFAEVTLTIE